MREHCKCYDYVLAISCINWKQAPQLNLFPGKHSIVVIDNCSVHHDQEIQDLIEGECGKYPAQWWRVGLLMIHNRCMANLPPRLLARPQPDWRGILVHQSMVAETWRWFHWLRATPCLDSWHNFWNNARPRNGMDAGLQLYQVLVIYCSFEERGLYSVF